MILVDTSVWIDFFNGFDSPEKRRLLSLLELEEDICITGIIVQEILQGISNPRKRREIVNDFKAFVEANPRLETHVRAAEIYCACRKKGITVRKSVDCLIAALALEHDLAILEKDRDFKNVQRVFPLKLVHMH